MGVVGAIMLLNLGAMLGAHLFMERIGAPSLLVLGAVFGVLQAAMAVEMIISGLTLSRLMA
jgi:multiple antibiotic resistance protein